MQENELEISIDPDPHILYVLTYAVMRPIDSLCELIDNSIDVLRESSATSGALIMIDLPTRREIEEGTALIRVRDNGPGMTLDQVQNALRAGYSSKRRYGNLGLFGVGFNIATGKLGRVTRVVTAQSENEYALEVIVDLVALRRSGNFKVKAVKIPKPGNLGHGTIVEVSSPWGEENQNYGFMQKLVSIGRPRILSSLGRIYATLLRDRRMRVMISNDTVQPYFHCIWGDNRYVEHQKHGKINAVFRFDNHVIHTNQRCANCEAVIPAGSNKCPDPSCGASSLITVEEKVSGWVGIQRYMDSSHYGIDLIRNGRAIRTLEKEAFFEFQDPDTGEPIVDYPIDDRQGRIVGEIHINHVPVDPTKQNFERSSPEWRRAIEYLRGTSSLQPTKPGADKNASPIFKLYQGYRKVREPGKRSMYMGKWAPGSSSPALLTRTEIDVLKERFDKQESGYFDDAEWWKLVEQADEKPVPGLKKCPTCSLETHEDSEECPGCGYIYDGKRCINNDCGQMLLRSAVTCPHCGFNQIPDIIHPWECEACGNTNSEENSSCAFCSNPRGTPDPVSLETLTANSVPAEALSVPSLTIALASGDSSSPIDICTRLATGPIYTYGENGSRTRLPSVRFASNVFAIFIDPTHALFAAAGFGMEEIVAAEVAAYLFTFYQSQGSKYPAQHSLAKLTNDIIEKYWRSKFTPKQAAVQEELIDLLTSIREKLAASVGPDAHEIYDNLPTEEKTCLAHELTRNGRDLSELKDMATSGDFILFLRPKAIVDIMRINPRLFFDGNVWSVTFGEIPQIHPEAGEELQAELKARYVNCLETVALFAEGGNHDPSEVEMARAAAERLRKQLAN